MRPTACLAIVWATCAVAPGISLNRREADFDWAIKPHPGYPIISFDSVASGQEVIFQYDTPLLHENKTYHAVVYENDCLSVGDASLSVTSNASVDRVLSVELNVDEGTVSASPYWFSYNGTTAVLSFCLRIDYYLYDESVNFHETNVTITIDLRAGFNLTKVNQSTVEALQYHGSGSMADYPVLAYHCDDQNARTSEDRLLTQGDMLQLCVKADSALAKNVFVTDILSLDLDQPSPNGTHHGDVVENFLTDDLTTKRCKDGICNIRSQLTTQWFTDVDPEEIVASGVAVLAFGNAGSTRVLLRVPLKVSKRIRDHLERNLQESGSADMFGKFVVYARLASTSNTSSQSNSSNSTVTSYGLIVVYVLLGVVAFLAIAGSMYILLQRRRRQKSLEGQMEEKIDLVPTQVDCPQESEKEASSAQDATLDNELKVDEVEMTAKQDSSGNHSQIGVSVRASELEDGTCS